MFLKRLEIVGFKSFTERTAVAFSPGISAVVGPNGCGKSNIIDAIRWVMGEQSPRLLRTRNMEDLLFNGSLGRSQASVAEVTLTMARELDPAKGQAEISVTRRLYRGGDSEYLVNRIPSRLKDLVRFFIEAGMGTRAYNIIEQEKVGRLVDAPPEERRLLIDEAAGITRFKEQKKESERRLEQAEQNLATVATLLSETARRLSSVTRAAAKAARWQSLRADLRGLELVLSAKRFLEYGDGLAGLRARAAGMREALALMEADNSRIELAVDALRLTEAEQGQLLETELGAFHQQKAGLDHLNMEIGHLEGDLESASGRRESALDDLAGLDDEYGRHQTDLERLEKAVGDQTRESREAEAERQELREKWRVVKSQCDLLAERRSQAGARLEKARDHMGRLGETLAGAESLAEHLKGRHRALGLESNQADLTLAEARERLASRERFKAMIEEDLAGMREEAERFLEERDLARLEVEAQVRLLGEAEKTVAALSSRLDTLENLRDSGFGWYPDGAVALLKDPEARGLIGPVAESLEVPDGYEEAAEAALGDKLGWILVTDRRAGLEALRLAREKGLGRCGFVSGEGLRGQGLSEALLGRFEPRPCLSPDMLDSPSSFLTLEGDFLGPTLMAGGGPPAEAASGPKGAQKPAKAGEKGQMGLLARLKELEGVSVQLQAAEDAAGRLNDEVAAKRGTLSLAQEALSTANNRLSALNADLNDASSKIMVAASEVKGLAIRRDSLSGEIARNESEMAACEEKREAAASEREALAGQAGHLEEAFQQAVQEAESRNGDLEELREQGQAASSRADAISERLEGTRREMARVSDWIDNLENRQTALEALAGELLETQEALAGKIDELRQAVSGGPESLAQAEERLRLIRQRLDENRAELLGMEEEAKKSRKAREEAASGLGEVDRELLEAGHGLEKITGSLLRDWRVVFIDPNAPATVEPGPGEGPGTYVRPGPGEDAGTDGGAWTDDLDAQDGDQGDGDAGEAAVDEAPGTPPVGDGAQEGADPGPDHPGQAAGEEPEGGMALAPPEVLDPNELAARQLPETAEATILGLREKLAALGEVNLEAIREEAELSKSHAFHKTQL
ncbi:MAG: AAA family ATPase, partial [Deltaproteobacteria bacterium]|nr:AAA family ATPase [Deltaproteobacteria bacterium]